MEGSSMLLGGFSPVSVEYLKACGHKRACGRALKCELAMGSMEEYRLLETPLSTYVLFNAACTIFCAVWLAWLFGTRRHLFLKPSLFLLTITHVFFQWPSFLFAGYVESFLPEPYPISLLIHGYIILGTLISTHTGEKTALEIWGRLPNFADVAPRQMVFVVCLLGAFIGLILVAYCSAIPFSETGIYAAIFAPSDYDVLRTTSFENLPSLLRYAFRLMADAAAPWLASCLALIGTILWRRGKPSFSMMLWATVLPLAAVNGLTGARYDSVKLLATAAAAIIIFHRIPFRPIRYLTVGLAALIPAALLTLLRENQALSLANSFIYLFEHILFHRVLVTPFQVGVWHVQFAQLAEQFGIAAIPKLAALMEVAPTAVPLVIGKIYLPHPTFNSFCNGGYLLTYFSYFGPIALPICLGLLFMLDGILFLYRKLSPLLLVPCIATFLMCCLELIQSDFTTALLSHGILFVPALGLLLHLLFRRFDGNAEALPRT
jgi:hypothetical protein